MKAVLPHALEFYPMQAADLDAVAQIEAGIQAFPWSRGNFADSLHAGYSAWVARLPDRLIGFSVVMQVLDEENGNIARTAKRLNISRTTVYKYISS